MIGQGDRTEPDTSALRSRLKRDSLAAFEEIRAGLAESLRLHPEVAGKCVRGGRSKSVLPSKRSVGLSYADLTVEATIRLLRLLFLLIADARGLEAGACRLRVFGKDQDRALSALEVADSTRRKALRLMGCDQASDRRDRAGGGFECMDVRRLGDVYEAILERISGDGEGPERSRPVSARKSAGRYYTPENIVSHMVGNALGRRLRGLSSGEILRSRVLDPAMGSGRFLVRAADFLAQAYGRALKREAGGRRRPRAGDIDRYRSMVIRRCVYGVDTDPIAVDVARASLWLLAGGGPKTMQALTRHLRRGDALTGSAFGGNGSPGFDVVLGNPPYLSFSGRQKAGGVVAPAGGEGGQARLRGWPSAHGLFILKAAGLLRKQGVLSFITPGQVGHLKGYGPVRAALTDECDLLEVRYWGEHVFKGVTTPALTFVARKHGGNGRSACVLRREEGGSDRFLPEGEDPWFVSPDRHALRRMAGIHPTIETFCDPGVHTGNVAAKLVASKRRPGWAPVIEGRQVRPFHCEPPGKWLNTEYEPGPGEYFRFSAPRIYKDVDVLIKQTAPRPVAARHSHHCRFRNSVLALKAPEGFSIEYLVGILNSEAAALLYRALSPEAGQRAFPQIKVHALRRLPVPDPRLPRNKPAVGRIERIVRTIETRTAVGKPVDRRLQRLNTLVWNLYGMTGRMGRAK